MYSVGLDAPTVRGLYCKWFAWEPGGYHSGQQVVVSYVARYAGSVVWLCILLVDSSMTSQSILASWQRHSSLTQR